jgi:hypothetical protein
VVPVAAVAALGVYGFLMACVPRRDDVEEVH